MRTKTGLQKTTYSSGRVKVNLEIVFNAWNLRPLYAVGIMLVVCGCGQDFADLHDVDINKNGLSFNIEATESEQLVEVVLSNKSLSKAVSITGFRTSCSCLGVEPKQLVIPAGGDSSIFLRVEPIEFMGIGRNVSLLATDSTGQHKQWSIKGRAKSLVGFAERDILINHETSGPPTTKVFDVYVDSRISNLEIIPAVDWITVDVTQKAMPRRQATATITPEAPIGPFRVRCEVIARGKTGEKNPVQDISICGTVRERIFVRDSLKILGNQISGQPFECSFDVCSSSREIRLIGCSPPSSLSVGLVSVGRQKLVVRGKYLAGAQEIQLKVQLKDSKGDVFLPLKILYFGN